MSEFENNEKILVNHTISYIGQKGSGKTFLMMASLNEINDRNVLFFDTLGVLTPQRHKNVIFIKNIKPNIKNYREIIKMLDKFRWDSGKVKIVFNLKEFDVSDLVLFLDTVSLFVLDRKIKCGFMVDEISDYCRQGKRQPYPKVFERLVRVGRNFGITPVIMATQRPQLTEKDVLALCDCYVIFRLMYSLDREKIRELVGQTKEEFKETDRFLLSAKERAVIIISQDNPQSIKTMVKKI